MFRVPFESRRPLDPKRTNIGLDANALDQNGTDRDELVRRFCKFAEDRTLNVLVAAGVRDEVEHPRTPANVKAATLPRIFNLRPALNADQQRKRRQVWEILTGNARPDKHAADASHLSEAAETGCAYFITHDRRIIAKRQELRDVLPPSLTVVTLEEFFEVFDAYETGDLV